MNANVKSRLVGGVGILLGLALIAGLLAVPRPVDPLSEAQRAPATKVAVIAQAPWQPASAPLLAEAALGRAIVEIIGAGIAFGLLGLGLSRVAARRRETRPAELRETSITSDAAMPTVVVTLSRVADATASEFDDRRRPSFAPVTSLTEAQVGMRRAQRQRQEPRAARTRA